MGASIHACLNANEVKGQSNGNREKYNFQYWTQWWMKFWLHQRQGPKAIFSKASPTSMGPHWNKQVRLQTKFSIKKIKHFNPEFSKSGSACMLVKDGNGCIFCCTETNVKVYA